MAIDRKMTQSEEPASRTARHATAARTSEAAVTDERVEHPMSNDTTEEEIAAAGYGKAVGDRLRHIRRQKRLSLQEVETISAQEFKASVLGAYERGERAISVPRLQRLARFYKVPVDQ